MHYKADAHKRMRWTWLCAAHVTLFVICSLPAAAQLTGTWIGVHTEYDTDDFCPLPAYLQLGTDGAYALGMMDGSAVPMRSTWATAGDSVRLDTIRYAPGLVKVQDSLLRIGANYPMVFRKFTDVPVDSVSAYRQLSGRVWQSDSLIVSLYANGQVSLENRTTHQRTAHFWRLARFGTSVFLVIRGNQYDRESGYKPLWQLSRVSAGMFTALGWQQGAVREQPFRPVRLLTSADTCQPNGFQTCSNCFSLSFFKTNPGRTPQRYALLQRAREQVKTVDLPGQSGLVQVQFMVNCRGESGRYDVTGLDADYRPKLFNKIIIDQLLTFCRNNIATEATLREPERVGDRLSDLAVAVTFRLIDGHVTDLLP